MTPVSQIVHKMLEDTGFLLYPLISPPPLPPPNQQFSGLELKLEFWFPKYQDSVLETGGGRAPSVYESTAAFQEGILSLSLNPTWHQVGQSIWCWFGFTIFTSLIPTWTERPGLMLGTFRRQSEELKTQYLFSFHLYWLSEFILLNSI